MVFVDRANMDKWAPFYSLKKKKSSKWENVDQSVIGGNKQQYK